MNWEGTVFGGKYVLGQKLGQGGMGSVWRAEHVQLKSPVVIKLIEQSIATNPEALARFMREAQSAAALRSPHVVQILDHGADHGVPYIAMELLEGDSLAQRLERVRRLSPQETSFLMTQVARAVTKAHEAGIVHRDLKPDNIFIVKNDDEEVAKVLDFGIAKTAGAALGPSSSTRTGAVLGTPYYMSPEQAEGNRLVDFRTDIWALGVIVYECIVGQRPFESEAFGSLLLAICTRPLPVPSTFGPVPPGFDAWFARACAREPERRFGSAREAMADLRRVCGDMPGSLSGYDPHARASSAGAPPHAAGPTANPYTQSVDQLPPKRRTGTVLFALAFGAVVLGLGAVALMKTVGQKPSSAEPTAEPASKPAAPAPEPPKIEVVPTPVPIPTAAAEPVVAPAVASAAPATVPTAALARPTTLRGRPSKPVRPAPVTTPPARAVPPPPPAPAPPPAAKEPTPSKPKVNLGI